jgi:hypothetical protein
MTDILARLTIASWRGLGFPCAGRTFGFRQEFARHRYVFRDDELIDSLGRENPTYTFTLPAREDLAKGPWTNWFTRAYPDFLRACQDRSVGILIDPVHGEIEAKCASLSETLDVNRRDGVDVQVEFIYAPEQAAEAPEMLAIESIEGAQGMAGFLDQESEKVDYQQEAPPEPTLPLFDAIRGIGDQLEVARSRITANMARLSSQMEQLDRRVDALKNPDNQPFRRNARRMALAAYRLNETATTPPNPTKIIINQTEIGIIALAALHKISVDVLLSLNPALKRKSTVKRGEYIRVNR